MGKIYLIGNCFIRIGDSLINLKQYSKISKYKFGYDEDPDRILNFGIKVTPLQPDAKSIENGVDGSFLITTYTKDEEKSFEIDFDTIISALKN